MIPFDLFIVCEGAGGLELIPEPPLVRLAIDQVLVAADEREGNLVADLSDVEHSLIGLFVFDLIGKPLCDGRLDLRVQQGIWSVVLDSGVKGAEVLVD